MKDFNIKDCIYEAIVAYYDNNLTKEQADELISWISEDKNNLHYFRETGKVWLASGMLPKRDFDTVKAFETVLDRIKENDIRPMQGKVIHLRLSSIIKYAAAIVILLFVGAGSAYLFRNRTEDRSVNYVEAVAPKGSRTIITLADGSTIWLNSDTKIRYKTDFGHTNRELYLQGEAYFVVAENKTLPFRVNTSDICITAIGTSFNVKAYIEENVIETTLEKGEVRIDKIGTNERRAAIEPVYLRPNQKAVYSRGSDKLAVKDRKEEVPLGERVTEVPVKPLPIIVDTLVDTKLSTSWKDSKWIFKSENLNKLKPILERRYDITIVFNDSSLCHYKFTGTILEESLDQVLKALSISAPIKYSLDQNKVTLFEDPEQIPKFRKIQKITNQ
jgi:ferric-dicitrate binding protein FerR (iron transport regulator)